MAAAYSPGTSKNHQRQAKLYIAFMLTAGYDPLFPSLTPLLHYVQLLANSFAAVTSVKNYLSGAKTYVRNAGGDPTPFTSRIIPDLLRGVTRLSTHVPSPAITLQPETIKAMCDVMWAFGPDARVARAAVLFAFATFLRQSNFLYTPSAAGHMLTRRDVLPAPYGLAVHVASTKTNLRDHPVVIPVHRIPNCKYCPVAAYLAARAATQAPLTAPLFLTSTGSPLTPHGLAALMRTALNLLGRDTGGGKVTPHSLRRSGATAAARWGAGRTDVMTHGTWKGDAVDSYVPKTLFTAVPQTIKTILGNATSAH